MRSKVGHYDIVCELGRGGMGVVYKGYERALNRYVAIKTLSESLSHVESVKERFLREARSMAQLNDPYIIQIYFIGEDDGQPFFAMEFVEGESLSSFLKREGKLTPAQAAKVIHQTALGLATAHDKGVIHRDIKPGNLMLTTRGTIKIADFGIALAQQDLSKKLTATGEFVGTPGYLSPEVCLGKPVDLRSDIFSLGIVLFEMLTGRMPFTDESPLGLMLEVVKAEVPDVRQLNGEVDSELARILAKMVAKDPNDRYASCHELVADLQKHPGVMAGGPISLQAKLPPAAATVIGMTTPADALAAATQRDAVTVRSTPPTPSTQRFETPSVHPQPAPSPAPASPIPAGARPSVIESQQRRSGGSNLAWPIAAVVMLAVLGAAGFAFRDRLGTWFRPGAPAAVVDTSTPTVSTVATTFSPTAPPTLAATRLENTATSSSDSIATPASTPPTSLDPELDAAPTHSGLASADRSSDDAIEPAPGLAVLDALAQRGKDIESSRTASPNVSTADEVEPRATKVGTEHPAVARNVPPPERARRPSGPPRIMVVSFGDPAIALAAEGVIEEALESSGFLLADEDSTPGVAALIDSGAPDMSRLFAVLSQAKENVRALTVIRAQPLGATPISFYGQSDTLYSANLSIKTWDVLEGQPIGTTITEKVDFTHLSAPDKAREVLETRLGRYLGALSGFHPNGANG